MRAPTVRWIATLLGVCGVVLLVGCGSRSVDATNQPAIDRRLQRHGSSGLTFARATGTACVAAFPGHIWTALRRTMDPDGRGRPIERE